MKMPSSSGRHFAQVPKAQIERSQFDRSFSHKTTFNAGYLIPVYLDEVLPGDTFNTRMSGFFRLATPLKPIMDNLYLDSFFFFIPYRLIWANFQKFCGEQVNPGDSTSFNVPKMAPAGGPLANTIWDYFGIPGPEQITNNSLVISALPGRAYALVYNQWFRDENLVASLAVPTGDGPDAYGLVLQRRGKRHDYFTSCLPFVQKGASVSVPLASTAPVVPITPGAVPVWRNAAGSTGGSFILPTGGETAALSLDSPTGSWSANAVPGWSDTKLIADLTNATLANINQLRQAFQIQRLLERDARGGTRYTEIVRSHFGVVSPDARLQRPEYLGGGSSPVMVSPIAQTQRTDTGTGTPQGNLAGVGTVNVHGHGFAKSFTEHGLILGLVSVRSDYTYQQGVDRMWFRTTRYDFYWPALSHLGEQAVLNQEIYCKGDGLTGPTNDGGVFGYQERYAEYRYKPSMISGQFRSTLATPLDVWHLAQEFNTLPVLGQTFIEENPPISRVIAVTTEPHFIGDMYFKQQCARPMPVYGVPGFVDHF